MAKTGAIRAGQAYVEVFADNSKLIKGMRAAEKRIQDFGKSVRTMGLYIAAAGAAIVAPLIKASMVFSTMGDNIAKMSQRTGLSVEMLSAYNFITGQAGTSMESFEKAIKKMQQSIYDLKKGLSTSVDSFNDLKISLKDIEELSPEEQFALIAGQIAKIKNASMQAAIAQKIFGKSGTELLPMIKLGKEGITALRKEAERLGLVMSEEDTKAAEEWNDTMDRLSQTIKMGIFRVGQAMVPILTGIANSITKMSAQASKFLKENKEIVSMVFYFGVGLIAAGIIVTTFGEFLEGLANIIGTLRVALIAFGKILAITFTPFGLIITGGIAILTIFGKWGEILNWLGGRFAGLQSDASKAFEGISAALASGNIGLAAQILWLTLKMEWQKGTNNLLKIWVDFKRLFLEYFAGIDNAIALIWATAMHGMQSGWNNLITNLQTAWIGFKAWYEKDNWGLAYTLYSIWDAIYQSFRDMWLDIKGLWIDLFGTDAEKEAFAKLRKKITEEQKQKDQTAKQITSTEQDNIDKNAAAQSDRLQQEYQKRQGAIDKKFSDTKENIGQDYANDLERINKDSSSGENAIKQSEQELAKTVKEFDAAIKAAKEGRPAEGMPATPKLETGGLLGLSGGGSKSFGTFSGYGLEQVGRGGPMDKISKHTEENARLSAIIAQNTRNLLEEIKG